MIIIVAVRLSVQARRFFHFVGQVYLSVLLTVVVYAQLNCAACFDLMVQLKNELWRDYIFLRGREIVVFFF